MTACIDDETVLGMIEGRLAPPVLAAADEHLDGCATCRDVIAQFARTSSPARVLERGRSIGRYVIGDLLGSGAMGRVYSAWQPELDRRVAIKLLREDAPAARDRLVREAQAMARLDHPNVVGVHEVGTTDDGVFVAMDLVDGETLRTWAERHPPWRDVVRVLVDIARGLAAVHAAGVIHRDVKPDNLIISRDGRARIGDFGLARTGSSTGISRSVPVDATAALDSTLISDSGASQTASAIFQATSIAGTPVYMAPEVLRGQSATTASDQFGFGVTAYELLAGKRPFSGQTWAELTHAIETTSPVALRGVPTWLDAAIRRCLAVDPARRFASLDAIASLFAERLQRRSPALWIAGVAALVASSITWVAVRGGSTSGNEVAGPACDQGATEIRAIWTADRRSQLASADTAIDRWTAAWATERDATCRAASTSPPPLLAAREHCLERQRDELAALIARATSSARDPANPLADRVGDALAAFSPLDCRSARPNTADPIPLDPDRAMATREVERGLPAIRAAVALGTAREIDSDSAKLVDRARSSGHAPTIAEALLARAEVLRATARLPEGGALARDAVAAAERGHADDIGARAWIVRVAIAGDRRELAAAEDLAPIAEAAIDRAGAPRRQLALLLRLRALVAHNRGRLDEAKALLGSARAIFVEVSGERSIDIASVETSLGSTARAAGDLVAAERHHRLALAIDRELRGPKHPDIARDLHNIAGVLRLRGELDAALATYMQALEIELATRGEASTQVAITRNSVALVAMARGEWNTARRELESALATFTSAGHGDRGFVEHNLGLVAAATGDHARALAHYERAAAIYAATIGDDAQAPIRLLLDRARSLAARPATLTAARADGRRALDAARKADIAWIVDDATKFLATAKPEPPIRVSVEPPQPNDRPVQQPTGAKQDPPPRPQPIRDVGTYGSSQGW